MRWPTERPWSRVMGLRSVFAKTVRDSRRAAIGVGLLAGLFMLGTGVPYGIESAFSTLELRQIFVNGLTSLPLALRGLLGEPINIETMGGFLSWRVGNTLPVILGLWSVIALAGTLAGEAAKGSLDLVVSTPVGRGRLALQKLAGHVSAVIVAMLMTAVIIWFVGFAFGALPGDEIPIGAALGQVTLYGLLMLASGSLAFATSSFIGRTRALALGLVTLFAGYLIESYASLSPVIASLRPVSWYSWTAGHRPMAGVSDWPSVALLAGVTVVLMAVGVLAFRRRDLGDAGGLRWLRLPALPAGIGGPFRRQLADRTGIAIGWGIGIGLYAGLIVASADAFAQSLTALPQIVDLVERIYPGIDIRQPAGILQLTFFGFGAFIFGLAGASFLAGWASDEGAGRLDVVLSTPLSRAAWALRSGLGVLAAIAVLTVVLALFVTGAIALAGGDIGGPVLGMAVLGLAAAGYTGIGLAVGGLVRSSLAAGTTAALVIATFLLDSLGAALRLPDPILQLSLYKHLGQPMSGIFDPVGLLAATIMTVGGLGVAVWGLTRRDVGT